MPDHAAPEAAPADVANHGNNPHLDAAVDMDARPTGTGEGEAPASRGTQMRVVRGGVQKAMSRVEHLLHPRRED